MVSTRPTSRRRILIFAAALMTLSFSAFQAIRESSTSDLPASEAVIRTSLARDLFTRNFQYIADTDRYEEEVDSRGYHLLINSAAVAPLPTLSTLPFAWWREGSGIAFLLIGAILAFALVCYLPTLTRLMGLHWMAGLIAALLLTILPQSPFAAWQAPQALGFLLVATAVSTHLAAWLRVPHLRSLALAANWIGWGALWDIRALYLAVVMVAVVAGRSLRPLDVADEGAWRHSAENPWHPIPASAWRRMEGWIQITLLPILLPVCIWILFNWLIFGNPRRLFEGLPVPFVGSVKALLVPVMLISALFFILSRFWSKSRLAVVSIYGGLLVGSLFIGLSPDSSAVASEIVAAGPVEVSREDLADLNQYILENTPGRLKVVAGRPGYALRKTLEGRGGVEHYLDIDRASLEERTIGRDVYVILSEAQSDYYSRREGMENWRRRFLLEAEFGPWRVYRFLKPWVPGQ
ncbi:MAG: hypothetical protein ACOC2L_05095 [Candidatus Sumerlaeota bacterium]